MGTTTEKLLLEISAKVDGFTSGIGKIKDSIGEADGLFGKLKAGAGGLKDAFNDLGPGAKAGLAAGGIGAVGTVAFEAASKFEHLGLAVGEFSDKTGFSTQEASRWIEVAGHMGIDAGTLEGAIGKLEKNVTPKKFEEYGIAIAHTKDGMFDANGTFLNAIDALHGINDASVRAKEGAAIFGKGWQTISELVDVGASGLKTKLGEVADIKILSPKDVQDARDFRDTMNKLKDMGEELALTFGKALLPAVQGVASALKDAAPLFNAAGSGLGLVGDAVGGVVKGVEKLKDGFVELWDTSVKASIKGDILDLSAAVKKLPPAFDAANVSSSVVRDAMSRFADAAKNQAAKAAGDLADAIDRAKVAGDQLTAQWQALTSAVSNDQAFIAVQNQFDAVKAAAKTAWDAASSGAADATQKARANQSAVDDLKSKVIDYGKAVLGLPPEQVTKILGEIDNGSLDVAANQLAIWARDHAMNVAIQANQGAGYAALVGAGGTPVPHASGGVARAGELSLVGEQGPELVRFGSNTAVTPADQTRQIMGGGGRGGDTYVFNVRQIPSGREMAQARARAARNGFPA